MASELRRLRQEFEHYLWARMTVGRQESDEPYDKAAARADEAFEAVRAAVRAEAVAEWREAVSEYLRLFDAEDWGVVEAEDRLRALLEDGPHD